MLDKLFQLDESTVRLAVFIGVFVVMALWELFAPRRGVVYGRGRRWVTNLGIVVADTVALRVLFPVLAVGMAEIAQARGWGLFSLTELPAWLEIASAAILLDLAIYAQHVAAHKVPILWRLHRVHHADRDFDVTTGLRFHPIEICLSMLWKFVVIIALGADPLAVLIFEVVLNGCAMFNHGNTRLPLAIDRVVRLVVVTPDMHRVHHSVIYRETDSNYGFNLSIWDRLFGTYIAQPRDGHDGMTIGLAAFQTVHPTELGWSLMLPFRNADDPSQWGVLHRRGQQGGGTSQS
jgi:sterol desaturase/sphingolipid hydroxylase (fatty acid hydroxylase superfamily)